MFRLEEFKAGDFIDLENYYFEISKSIEANENDALIEIVSKFFVLLNGKVPTNEDDYVFILKEFEKQLIEIKETYTWIYNPPSTIPSSIENDSVNNDLKTEFTEDYGGYIEIIYILCNGKYIDIPKVLEMKTKDFLFWGEYALRKRIIETTK